MFEVAWLNDSNDDAQWIGSEEKVTISRNFFIHFFRGIENGGGDKKMNCSNIRNMMPRDS